MAVVVLVGLTLGGLALGGVFDRGPTEAEKQAQAKAAALTRKQDELKPRFEALMTQRAAFFTAERQYLPAMKRAKASVAAYNKKVKAAQDENERISAAYAPAFAQCAQYSYVNCPDPDYAEFPDAPDVDDEVKQLTTVANSMTSLKAELVGIQATGDLATAYAQLQSAVEILGQDAKENVTILNEAVTLPDEGDGGGYVDKAKLKALNGNDSLPTVKQMNATLVRILKDAQIPMGSYDLPGGQDLDPADHSRSV
ncbi:hypothetical protein [Kineosporia succinea]|uniref:Uncharacterized protein n=1 Tax=Kineosporia succinea TaxID=84632 RepID=A0ABT9NX63_9ACTN|nr:hypothetical protein [Kineosporia succinea]MDP9825021.1 hypothetical protein [Kineosporia succinea]